MRQFVQGVLAYICVQIFQFTTVQAQQIWTYDFGTFEGERLSGDVTTFLSQDQSDGGIIRIRIGSTGGSVKVENPGNPTLGTYSQLAMVAPTSTSSNIFEIKGYESSQVFYTKLNLRLSGGTSGNIHFIQGGGDDYGTNSGYLGDSFMGIRWSFESDGSIETNLARGSVNWSPAFIDEANLFVKDVNHKVEIYGNNNNQAENYYRDGESFSLDTGKWSIWVDNIHIGDFEKQDSFDENNINEIDSFMIYAQNSDDNTAQIEIDDLVYSNTLADVRTIEGGEGWRMLASPMNDTEVEQFARQNLVQGVTDSHDSDELNFYTAHQGQDQTNDPDGEFWTPPSDLSTTIDRGNGFIWYLYDNSVVPESKPLPMDVVIAKNQHSGDVQVSLNTQNQGWNILGNPFSEDLFVDDINNWDTSGGNGELASNNVQIWNSSFSTYEILGGSSGDKVGSMQGFFLQTDGADELIIPESEISSAADSPFYKNSDNHGVVAFEIKSESENSIFLDKALKLYFGEDAQQEWDVNDAEKITPLSKQFISAGFIGKNRFGEPIVKAQDSRSISLKNSISIPLNFTASELNGLAEFTMVHIDEAIGEFVFEIEDLETGIRQQLTKGIPFQFHFTQTLATKDMSINQLFEKEPYKLNSAERFLLHISPNQNGLQESQTPEHFTLHQNYPNPFNPTTQITYELPEQSPVKLEVYDMIGRQVATLVDEPVAAGIHHVNFDASNLSSGVYIYRLVTSRSVYTKKLTVLK